MPVSPVARRYAQALIEVAEEAGAIDQIGADLNGFAQLLDAHEGMLGGALGSPVFTTEERSAVLDGILPKLPMHPLSSNLLRLLNDKRRFPALQDIVVAYGELADARAGRQAVTVTTAEPLTPQVEAEIRQALEASTGKQVRLTTKVDPSLLGGLIAKVGGTVYDSSLRTRLDQIKHALVSSETAIA